MRFTIEEFMQKMSTTKEGKRAVAAMQAEAMAARAADGAALAAVRQEREEGSVKLAAAVEPAKAKLEAVLRENQSKQVEAERSYYAAVRAKQTAEHGWDHRESVLQAKLRETADPRIAQIANELMDAADTTRKKWASYGFDEAGRRGEMLMRLWREATEVLPLRTDDGVSTRLEAMRVEADLPRPAEATA